MSRGIEVFAARAVRRMNDVRFDEQIVVKEIGRESVIGAQAAHAAGCQNDDLGTVRGHPIFDLGLASQINASTASIAQQSATFALKPTHHSAAYHPMLTGDPDKPVGQIKRHRSCPSLYSWSWPAFTPANHKALLKTVISLGSKLLPIAVHCVTLPSFPNLYSWVPLAPLFALNHADAI